MWRWPRPSSRTEPGWRSGAALAALAALWLNPASATCPAAAPDPLAAPYFTTIGADEIPRGVVASITQDQAGFLWIATGDGLVRFDGFRFVPMERAHKDPVRRNLGWIRVMLPGHDGRTWFGTEVDGLAVHDPATGRIIDHGSARSPSGFGRHPVVTALAEGKDGAIWVGSDGGGLQRFDQRTGRFEVVSPDDDPAPRARVLSLAQADNVLWVGTWQGLFRGALVGGPWQPVVGLTGQVVTALHLDSQGRLWVGTAAGGVAVLGRGETRPRWIAAPGPGPGAPGDPDAVSALTSSAKGDTLWVGRGRGVDLHDTGSGCLRQSLRHDPAHSDGLGGNEVSSLLRDASGAIWVGGFGFGLQRTDPGLVALRLRQGSTEAGGLFSDPDTRALLTRPDGGLWAATHAGPLVAMDAGLRVQGRVPADDGPPWQSMAPAADGGAWLGRSGELLRVEADGRPMRRHRHTGGATNRMLEARDGRLWIATQGGLYRLAPGDAAPTPVHRAEGGMVDGEIFALAEAPDGEVWIGGQRGLLRVVPSADTALSVEAPDGADLASTLVLGLLFDRDGTLWLDTAVAGLHRMTQWNGHQARFDAISVRHGVFNRPFGVNLLQDSRGRIWTQMYVYDPSTDRLHALTPADGAAQGTGWFRAYTQLADGRLVFGSSRGLLVVDAAHFDPPDQAPPVRLTGLQVDGQPRPLPQDAGPIDIAPGSHRFSVEFAALDYADPRRTRYAYRLVGVDSDWVSTSAAFRSASYGNLAPGQYRLEVRGSNRAGVWAAEPVQVRVNVLPTWWQTGAARVSAVLALLILGALLLATMVQRRTRTLTRRQQALEDRVAERTTALVAATEQLRTQSLALEQASLTDPLTGLRNRRQLAQAIEADLALARQKRQQGLAIDTPGLVFFLIDIDHFKQVNDDYGHAAGDAVLAQMRGRLQQVFRDSDLLVRWGGEEFLVIARDCAREHAPEVAERLRAVIADTPFDFGDGQTLQRSCSIGFAAFPLAPACPEALDWEATVGLADTALLAVKRSGRDGWMGLLGCHASTPQAVQRCVGQPAASWSTDPALSVALRP
jgi:diguanylate cyclase (GGDEF)-like protein